MPLTWILLRLLPLCMNECKCSTCMDIGTCVTGIVYWDIMWWEIFKTCGKHLQTNSNALRKTLQANESLMTIKWNSKVVSIVWSWVKRKSLESDNDFALVKRLKRLKSFTRVNELLMILSVFYCLCKAQAGKSKDWIIGTCCQADTEANSGKEEAILKAKKEQLELETEIAANTARDIRIHMLSCPIQEMDWMNIWNMH